MAPSTAHFFFQRQYVCSVTLICLIASIRGMPCPISTSTCRNFTTISYGLGLLIAIYGPPVSYHRRGPLLWGRRKVQRRADTLSLMSLWVSQWIALYGCVGALPLPVSALECWTIEAALLTLFRSKPLYLLVLRWCFKKPSHFCNLAVAEIAD